MTTKSAPKKTLKGTAYKEEEEIINHENKGQANFMTKNRRRKKSQKGIYHGQYGKTKNPALIMKQENKNNNPSKAENQ